MRTREVGQVDGTQDQSAVAAYRGVWRKEMFPRWIEWRNFSVSEAKGRAATPWQKHPPLGSFSLPDDLRTPSASDWSLRTDLLLGGSWALLFPLVCFGGGCCGRCAGRRRSEGNEPAVDQAVDGIVYERFVSYLNVQSSRVV